MIEPGHYLTLRYEGDAKVMCGPFATAHHAWVWAYVADLLDAKRSDYSRLIAYAKNGESLSIMASKYVQEDFDAAASEGIEANYRFVAKPELKYPSLIGIDGLLSR